MICVANAQVSPVLEVATDAKGIVSSSLRKILENWPAGKPKPKALYTVPVCQPDSARGDDIDLCVVWM